MLEILRRLVLGTAWVALGLEPTDHVAAIARRLPTQLEALIAAAGMPRDAE